MCLNMRNMRQVAAAIATASSLGCLPSVQIDVPAVTGRVVDPQGHPVPNAEVILTGRSPATRIALVKTDSVGRFYRGEDARLWFWPAIGDPYLPDLLLFARQGTHTSPTTRASQLIQNKPLGIGPHYTSDVGDIILR